MEGEEESPRPTVSGVSFRRYRGHLRSGGSQKAKTETRGTGLGLRRGSKTKVRAVRPHSIADRERLWAGAAAGSQRQATTAVSSSRVKQESLKALRHVHGDLANNKEG